MCIQTNFDENIEQLIDTYSISYKKSNKDKKKYEQYFTSNRLAQFMSEMIDSVNKQNVSILDPGCGLGILSIYAIGYLIKEYPQIKNIEVDLYEIDKTLINRLKKIFSRLRLLCQQKGVELQANVINKDFIEEKINDSKNKRNKLYDICILNPPYGKIETDSETDKLLKSINIDVPNLYAAFVAVSQQLLVKDGQLIAITPRSFCNGMYFTKFRRLMFENIKLVRIHLFDSRENCFSKDNVLQEVMIYKCKKTGSEHNVIVSHSTDDKFEDYIEREDAISKLVNKEDRYLFIKILKDKEDDDVVNIIENMPCSLEELGLTVSTGPIVDFRVKEGLLTKDMIIGAVPSIFPEHFNDASIEWPLLDIKKKYNYIFPDETVKKQLRANGNYVLVKRFTSKEEAKRVVARVWNKENTKMEVIGIDNKLNYYHINKRGIELELAIGLERYLNSTIVDRWFRTISGSTQVNVTDLKKLRYPDISTLINIAKLGIDESVDRYLCDVIREANVLL